MKKIYFLLLGMAWSCSSFAQAVPNAGMENWRNNTSGSSPVVNIHAPIGWYGFDSLVIADAEAFAIILGTGNNLHAQLFQENTIKNSGNSSAKVVTVKQDTLGVVPGSLSNAAVGVNVATLIGGGSIGNATTFTGGSAVTERITTVSAYVEFFPGIDTVTGLMGGKDTGALNIRALGHLHGKDTIVGTATVQILPAAAFTQITATLTYFDTTYTIDTIRIVFSSSGGGTSRPLDSSTLYVDDISMTGVPNPDHSGVNNIQANNAISIFPNPANSVIYINGVQSAGASFRLYSINGQAMATKTLNGNDMLDVSYLPEGLYFYAVQDNNGNTLQRGKIVLDR